MTKNDEELWSLEERFWTGGVEHYERALDPECVMAFPPPAGIMVGRGIVEGLKGAPRWSSVTMADRRLARPSADIGVLAYRAKGVRDGAPAYEAYCSSTYRRTSDDGWLLVQHQQTPV